MGVLLRSLLIVLFLLLAPARAAAVPAVSCAQPSPVKLGAAKLELLPDPAGNRVQMLVSGQGTLSAAPDALKDPATALCVAALGPRLRVNGMPACDLFDDGDGAFREGDRVEAKGGTVRFALLREFPFNADDLVVAFSRPYCAERLSIAVRSPPGRTFSAISPMPSSLAAGIARFDLPRPDPALASYDFSASFSFPDASSLVVAGQKLVGARSWASWGEGTFFSITQAVQAVLTPLAILLFISILQRKYPLPGDGPQPMRLVLAPLTLALAFFAAGNIAQASRALANNLLISEVRDEVLGVHWLPDRQSQIEPLLAGMGLLLVAAALVAFLIVRFTTRPDGPVRAYATVWLLGALAFAGGQLLAALVWWVEPQAPWLGFEGPAVLLSFAYALWSMRTLAPLFGLSGRVAAVIALMLAFTIFFPTGPVVRSASGIGVSTNSSYWVDFISGVLAKYLYAGALAALVFRLSAQPATWATACWIGFALLLQIAAFRIWNPTDAIVFGAVLFLFPVLLRRNAGGGRGKGASAREAKPSRELALLIASAATCVYFVQYVFAAGRQLPTDQFPLLRLSNFALVFATAYMSGELINRGSAYLRGGSATSKAAGIGLLILAANIAAGIYEIRGPAAAARAIAEYLAVISALIVGAAVWIDLRMFGSDERQLRLSDVTSRRAVARAIPVVSAIAAAIASAVAPILISELGDSVRSMVKNALPAPAAYSSSR